MFLVYHGITRIWPFQFGKPHSLAILWVDKSTNSTVKALEININEFNANIVMEQHHVKKHGDIDDTVGNAVMEIHSSNKGCNVSELLINQDNLVDKWLLALMILGVIQRKREDDRYTK